VAVGNEIDLMPSGPGIGPAFPGQLRPYFEVANNYASAVAYNALDYHLNDNPDALAAARRALQTMVRWKAWVPPRWRMHGLRTYYEVGVFTQLVAFGYDLIADELTPQEKAEVVQAFWEKVIEPTTEEYFPHNRDPIGASNWMANSLGGAIAAAVADAGDSSSWNQREGAALAQLTCAFEQLLQGLFPGDGSEAEPVGYENFAMQGISWGMGAFGALGMQPAGTQHMVEGFWWPYYATVLPGTQLGTGDFNGHLKALTGFAWNAEHADIPELQSFYEAGTSLDLSHGSPVGQNGRDFEQMLGPLDLACCSKPATTFNQPPPSRVFPNGGNAILRSGWDPTSTVISMRVGPWFNHEHHDEGSFQVTAFGQQLIAEAGHASYYTDPHYPDYFTQAAGHNTVLVDNDPFSQAAFAGRYWTGFTYPHFTAQLLADSFNYLAADLTSAYDGRLEEYKREYFFLKPDILIVRDRVRAASPHTYSWLLHAPPGSELEVQGPRASIKLKKASALLTAQGSNTTWEEKLVPIPAELFTDLDRKDIQPRREFVLTSTRAASTQFLVGMRFVLNADSGKPDLETWNEASGEGFKTTGGESTSIVFRTGADALRIGALSSDGQVLARRNSNVHASWLAIAAKRVQEGNQILFAATTPADVVAESRNGALELHLQSSATERITVLKSAKPRSVEIDGQPGQFVFQEGMVVLTGLPPGEHFVTIQ
jgi:Heparinase II/III-like protein